MATLERKKSGRSLDHKILLIDLGEDNCKGSGDRS